MVKLDLPSVAGVVSNGGTRLEGQSAGAPHQSLSTPASSRDEPTCKGELMAIFAAAANPTNASILHLALYRSWSAHKAAGGNSSNYDRHSGRILDFKEGRADAIEEFRGKVDALLGNDFVIAVVPSHDPAKGPGALHKLAAALAGRLGRVDGSSCLVRHRKIAKLATGGDRNKQVHIDSIRVEHGALIRGKAVLVLDDVYTSGGSMEACMDLLRAAGAAEVRGVVLGRTA